VTWGAPHQLDGNGSAQDQQDVEMEDRPAGVVNLIAHFDSISRARKPSKGTSGAGTPTPFATARGMGGSHAVGGRVTSPAVEQFQIHSRVRTGSIGRPPPVRFGTMGAAGLRVASPAVASPGDGHGSGVVVASGSPFGMTAASAPPAPRSSSMSMQHPQASRGFGTAPTQASSVAPDVFGHDRMGAMFGDVASTASSPFGFGPGMGAMGNPMAGHSIDSYGITSPGLNTPTSPFGAFDFGAPRVGSPVQSPMVDVFGNVDDLARFGNATASFSSLDQTALGTSPIPNPAGDGFGSLAYSSVSAFQNLEPFKTTPQGNSHHTQQAGGSGGTGGFGEPNIQIKVEDAVPSPMATQFGSQQSSSPPKDFRPPLPPRKAFLQSYQAQNAMPSQTHNQNQNQNPTTPAHTTTPSTPGFNIWRPPIPSTPKPVLATNHHQPQQPQPRPGSDLYFDPASSKMGHLTVQTQHQHQLPQQVSSPHAEYIKSEPRGVASPMPTTPSHQETTFSVRHDFCFAGLCDFANLPCLPDSKPRSRLAQVAGTEADERTGTCRGMGVVQAYHSAVVPGGTKAVEGSHSIDGG
jgi:hypothetical protein